MNLASAIPLSLRSPKFFVVRSITIPNNTKVRFEKWISNDEYFNYQPPQAGTYTITVATPTGNVRHLRMKVVACDSE